MQAPEGQAPGGPRLHVNIDHVATLRQARRGLEPDPLEFARHCLEAGAAGLTVHLRKDRRHIQDADLKRLRARFATFINLELCVDPEIVAIGLTSRADAFCLVPENRQEVTTEGGLNVIAERQRLAQVIPALRACGGLVSLFVDPDKDQLEASRALEAEFVELHTGTYANANAEQQKRELERLQQAAEFAHRLGLRVNAGHGLNLANVAPIARLPFVEELNIGHSIVADALLHGAQGAVQRMLAAMAAAQQQGAASSGLKAATGATASGSSSTQTVRRFAPAELPLRCYSTALAVVRAPANAAIPTWLGSGFVALTRTPEELTLICPTERIPAKLPPDWQITPNRAALTIATQLPMEAVGILAQLTQLLANANIPVLALSTYDTDWLLIERGAPLERAQTLLTQAGYPLTNAGALP